jgi:NADPH-dependent curcumin reductase CurA
MRIEGFINGEACWKEVREKGIKELVRLLKEKKISPANEVVFEGIEEAPKALIDLYKNKYHGKLIIKNKF